jgi:metal-dependent hydrolase (beta-lactamase superfamily II)
MASTGKEHIVINEAPLSYQVYVTPIIATATKDVPPGQSRSTWSPISATLISGRHDAVLVDPLMTIEQGMAVADWVSTTGKNLTTVYVTHGHGDHWLGLGAVRERFPGVRAVATPAVIDGHTDTDDTTVLHVPDIGIVVARRRRIQRRASVPGGIGLSGPPGLARRTRHRPGTQSACRRRPRGTVALGPVGKGLNRV